MWERKKKVTEVVAEAETAFTLSDEKLSYHAFLAIGRYFVQSRDGFDRDKALSYLDRAKALAPDEFEVHLQLLGLARRPGEEIPDLARREAEICLALRPDVAAMWQWVGTVLRDDKTNASLTRSVSFFEKAVQLDPSREDAFLALGLSLLDLKKFDKAERALSRCIELGSTYPEVRCKSLVLHSICLVYNKNKKWRDALSDIEAIGNEEYVEKSRFMKYNMACAYSLIGREAQKDPKVNPKSLTSFKDRGIVLLNGALNLAPTRLNDLEEWQEELKEWRNDTDLNFLRDHPNFPTILRK